MTDSHPEGKYCHNCNFSIGHTEPAKVKTCAVCTNTETQFTKFRPDTDGGKEVSKYDYCTSHDGSPGVSDES